MFILSCKRYQFSQRLSTILNLFYKGILIVWWELLRHRGNPTRMWDSSSAFCQGKNINRAAVFILSLAKYSWVHLEACWCHLNMIESCFCRRLPYFYQTRAQCPLKCATGTLMNVQQSEKNKIYSAGKLQHLCSTQHTVHTSLPLDHGVIQILQAEAFTVI